MKVKESSVNVKISDNHARCGKLCQCQGNIFDLTVDIVSSIVNNVILMVHAVKVIADFVNFAIYSFQGLFYALTDMVDIMVMVD